jgi:hypothetical protein
MPGRKKRFSLLIDQSSLPFVAILFTREYLHVGAAIRSSTALLVNVIEALPVVSCTKSSGANSRHPDVVVVNPRRIGLFWTRGF